MAKATKAKTADEIQAELLKETQPVPNDPSASRNQVPPGQTAEHSAGTFEQPKQEAPRTMPNDPANSRNQIPPGQATPDALAGQIRHVPPAEPLYRDPTDAEIETYINRVYPGKLEAIIGNKDKIQAELERLHGPGFITAYQKGNDKDPRYFSQTTWKELGGNSNKEGWRIRATVPPEVQHLQKPQ